MRSSAESDGLVAGGEFDVKPGDERVHVVGAANGELEWEGKGEIGDGAGVEVEGKDRAWVGHDGFEFNGIDEGFGEGSEFERSVVEPVDVVPD